MARTKEQKKEILEKLGDIVNNAVSLVFVNFHGIKVSELTSIRRKLKSGGSNFFVTKKTLLGKALTDKKYEGEQPLLSGELGIVYGADAIGPAREIYEFQHSLKDKVTIVGGVFEGKYMNKEEMTTIASIPPLSTLRGMFVNLINSPIQSFVSTLGQIAEKKTS